MSLYVFSSSSSRMAYLRFDVLPLFAYSVREDLPHLLSEVEVGLKQAIHCDAARNVSAVPLLHEPFMALATSIGGLVRERVGGNRLPIETVLRSTQGQLVVLWRPLLQMLVATNTRLGGLFVVKSGSRRICRSCGRWKARH